MKNTIKKKVSLTGIRLLIAFATLPILTCGCSGVDPEQLVPKLQPRLEPRVNKSVRVMDVTGGQETKLDGPTLVDNKDFKAALIATLENSRLFKGVSTASGDLDLYTTIRSQERKIVMLPLNLGAGEFRARLVVSYRFVDRMGRVIWLETYESEFGSTAFSGATRNNESREGSVRENLSSLVQGIKERWQSE